MNFMRILVSLFVFVVIATNAFGQEKLEENYLKEWIIFKKENAPFNLIKRHPFTIEVLSDKSKPKLGDLTYKRISYTTGQELLGTTLRVAAIIQDNLDGRNEIWKDPSKFFLKVHK